MTSLPEVPFGAWPSPLTADRMVTGAAAVGEIRGWVAEALPGEDYQTLVDLLRRLVQAFPPVPEP